MAQGLPCIVGDGDHEGIWWITANGDPELTHRASGDTFAVCADHWPIMLVAWLAEFTGADPEALFTAAAGAMPQHDVSDEEARQDEAAAMAEEAQDDDNTEGGVPDDAAV